MMRIDIAGIIFDLARRVSEVGSFIKQPWGPVFLVLSMSMATVAVCLIMVKQNPLITRMGGR